MKTQIVSGLKQVIRRTAFYASGRQWPAHVDPVVSAIFGHYRDCSKLADAVTYAQVVAGCIEQLRFEVRVVKNREYPVASVTKRFSFLLELVQNDLPPVDMEGALQIADVFDEYLRNFKPIELPAWSADVAWHCRRSSSFGHKGRLLAACIRCMRPRRCLELGTAYGLSTIFIVNALLRLNEGGRLSSIEGFDTCFDLAEKTLVRHFGDAVSCHKGNVEEVLEPIARALHPIDFMFHDAGHSEKAYIRDFRAAEPYLSQGSLLVVDDINWRDTHGGPSTSATYAGWSGIVEHPRVAKAVEVGGIIGIALLG